jgi:hypothetical protein
MNLRSHHRRFEVCDRMRGDLVAMNAPRGVPFPAVVPVGTAFRWICEAVMGTRAGLDAAKVRKMVRALWEAET